MLVRSFTSLLPVLILGCTHEPPRAPANEPPAPAPSASPSTQAVAGCSSDADCVIQSSYCGGCTCLAMHTGVSAPVCPSKPVNCLVDPCRDKKPRCIDSACAAAP